MNPLLKKLKRRLKYWRDASTLSQGWKRARQLSGQSTDTPRPSRLVILPSDPMSLIGAKGDEAMLCAVIAHMKQVDPHCEVCLITSTDWTELPDPLRRAGADTMLPFWDRSWDFAPFIREFEKSDRFVAIGADVMDGYYSPVKSAFIFTVADVAARIGLVSIITGFSFNETPHRLLPGILGKMDARVSIFLRDAISLQRFQAIAPGRGSLVSDVAFGLKPELRNDEARQAMDWIAAQRANGNTVLGYNVHPALAPGAPEKQRKLVESSISALSRILEDPKVSVILITHDYRHTQGDFIALGPVFDGIAPASPDRVLALRTELSAGELKQIGGGVDVLFTGRMHLSIAALGMGTPAGWATYQSKFEGLARHFGSPGWLLLSPQDAQDPGKLHAVLTRLIDERAALRQSVAEALPRVKELSSVNLAPLARPF